MRLWLQYPGSRFRRLEDFSILATAARVLDNVDSIDLGFWSRATVTCGSPTYKYYVVIASIPTSRESKANR